MLALRQLNIYYTHRVRIAAILELFKTVTDDISWKLRLKLIGKIILRSPPSSDRSFKILAYNRLNQNSALHLSLIKL